MALAVKNKQTPLGQISTVLGNTVLEMVNGTVIFIFLKLIQNENLRYR